MSRPRVELTWGTAGRCLAVLGCLLFVGVPWTWSWFVWIPSYVVLMAVMEWSETRDRDKARETYDEGCPCRNREEVS